MTLEFKPMPDRRTEHCLHPQWAGCWNCCVHCAHTGHACGGCGASLAHEACGYGGKTGTCGDCRVLCCNDDEAP